MCDDEIVVVNNSDVVNEDGTLILILIYKCHIDALLGIILKRYAIVCPVASKNTLVCAWGENLVEYYGALILYCIYIVCCEHANLALRSINDNLQAVVLALQVALCVKLKHTLGVWDIALRSHQPVV